LRIETRLPAIKDKEDDMTFRRFLTPVALIIALLVQFVPGTVFTMGASATSTALCDAAQWVGDITVPDGTNMAPGAAFTKTWRLINVGTCTWTTGYTAIFITGDQMGAPAAVNLPTTVVPGATVDITISMVAPSAVGNFRGDWKLKDPSGTIFGDGPAGYPQYNWTFYVSIVVGSTASTSLDLAANYCTATWTSGAGTLPCPGTSGSANGAVQQVAAPQLENGSYDTNAGLLVSPQTVSGGYIEGTYPAYTVQYGDRFTSIVNCAYGASACYVNFRLMYQIDSGPVQTFWTWKERYDGLFYRVNLNLSSLAGQSVKFILYVADMPGYGTPTGDQAMWSGPRILSGTSTGVTGPVSTPLPSSACNRGWFIADVTIPDGTVMAANTTFTKTWRLLNNGTCTWTTSYSLVYVNGDQMGATPVVNLPSSVAPGATIDLSVNMTAPGTAGHYRGNWELRDSTGALFGVGTVGSYLFWVDINVTGSYSSVYDFTANACAATWSSGAGTLPCYGVTGDPRGYVQNLGSPEMEDGSTGSPGLLTVPQNVTDGYITGIYPAFNVQNGDHFQALVSCENQGSGCQLNFNVNYKLDYQIGGGSVQNFALVNMGNTDTPHTMDVDLSLLAGQSVNFILTIDSTGSSTGGLAIWSAPRISRLVAPPPSGPTPTVGPGADLAVTIKDVDSSNNPITTYTPGTGTTYTVVVTNNGPLAVTGATFTDDQPPQSTGLAETCVPDPGALCTASGSVGPGINLTDSVNIPSGKKVTYSILSFSSGLATGIISNTVSIAPPAGVPDPIPTNNSATYNLTPPEADLSVTLSTTSTVYTLPPLPSGTVVYTAVVTNNGPQNVTDASFEDIQPPVSVSNGITVACATSDPGATCAASGGAGAGANYTDATLTLPAGDQVTYTIVLTVASGATSALTNEVQVTDPVGPPSITDPIPANNTASLTLLPTSADTMVSISDSTTKYVPGGTNTYVVVVTNNGPSDVVGGVFTDTIPTQVKNWNISCAPDLGATCLAAPIVGGTVTFNDNVSIPAGKKVTYTIVATINNPTSGNLVNTVHIANPAGLPDPVPGNNTAADTDTQ
jgi:uncharacterized repeat protein (TIGR01451 family)